MRLRELIGEGLGQAHVGRCPLCGCRKASLRTRVEDRSLRQCEQCGLARTLREEGRGSPSPAPPDAEFTHVTWTGKRYIDSEREFIASYQPLLDKLGSFVAPGRLLDIGCGLGFFAEAARRRGWHVLGVDRSPECREFASRHFGMEVQAGLVEDLALPAKSLDAIVLVHSIEHLEDPLTVLTKVREWLKPGGVLFIETPNIEGNEPSLYCEDWACLNVAEHFFVFGPTSLALLLHRAGFRVLEVTAPVYAKSPQEQMVWAWAEGHARPHPTRAEVLRALVEACGRPLPSAGRERDGSDSGVTRAEVAVLLAEALQLHGQAAEAAPPFPDVPREHAAWAPIHQLRQAGLVSGFADGSYRPERLVLPADLAALVRKVGQWRQECGAC